MIYININYEIIEKYNKNVTDVELKKIINQKLYNIISFMEVVEYAK